MRIERARRDVIVMETHQRRHGDAETSIETIFNYTRSCMILIHFHNTAFKENVSLSSLSHVGLPLTPSR